MSMRSALGAAFLSVTLAAGAMAQDTIPNDVSATFSVCLEGTGKTGDVCITGNNDAITNWGSGVVMTNAGGELWEVTVLFPSGTSAAVEYKYRSNGCVDWENDPNRTLLLPTDGTTEVTVDPESFNRVSPIGCGFSTPLAADVSVCLQVCLKNVDYSGDNCVIGNIPELGAWTTGVTLSEVGPDLFQACLVFAAGTLVPIDIQYKFQKDGCSTWEQVDPNPFLNRTVVIAADSPTAQTIMSPWSNGDSECDPVPVEERSWSTIKALYRD